ncbi:acyl-CoA/acyl-ACP dehydrogenase [Nostoc sp. CHAB 5824]|nr:acyl-CoA/acyl-ACP dehydrogenase [Nostoc sp. CHAB 5824]
MFLKRERETLNKLFPGLDENLQELSLMEMECENSPAIKLFRQYGGPGLLVHNKYGGSGASWLQAIQVQRALGSRSPSLAVAVTMHHITTVMIQEMVTDQSGCSLIEDVAKQSLYFSSGFAEGRTESNILESCMQVKRVEGGLVISGSKKPCTLSASMDFMTASILRPSQAGQISELALAVIPSDDPGIKRYPFWGSWTLLGTESNEVKLDDVYVPEECVYNMGDPSQLNSILTKTFTWFQILASSAYLGIASALVERILIAKKGVANERVALITEIEGAMSALEGIAYLIMNNKQDESTVAQALFIRYLVQSTIERVTARAIENLGGIAFIRSPEIAYLFASAHALAFHPPSRLSVTSGLDKYLLGEGPLEI